MRNVSSNLLKHRCVDSLAPWSAATWRSWCAALQPGERAPLPLHERRSREAAAVRRHVAAALARRPAASSRAALLRRPAAAIVGNQPGLEKRVRKRTPFSKLSRMRKLANMVACKRPSGPVDGPALKRRPAAFLG